MENKLNNLIGVFRRAEIIASSADPSLKYHEHLLYWTAEAGNYVYRKLQNTPPKTLLDVGTGTGMNLQYLAGQWPRCQCAGSDISESQVEVAKLLAQESGFENINFQTCPADALDYPDQSFEVLTCFFSMMYFQDAVKSLEEFFRVLKPGGKIFISSWTGENQLLDLVKKKFDIDRNATYPNGKNPFAYSDKASFATLLKGQTLKNFRITKVKAKLKWQGNEEQLWRFFKQTNPIIGKLLSELSSDECEKKENSIRLALSDFKDNQDICFSAGMTFCTITKN